MTPERDEDFLIVQRVQAGDKKAYNLLVAKYQRRVARLLTRMVKNQEDIDDVVQDTFIKAYRAIGNFRGESAFYTWIYRIAINTAKNHLVSRNRRSGSHDIDIADAELYGHTEQLSDNATPEAQALTEEIKQKVGEAIHKLPPDLRQAITLRELEGLSYEEIADAMDCPIGTVRSRIFRAREAIDKKLNPLLD